MFRTLHNLHYEQIGKEVRCIEDELPFEIPDSWEWIKLGYISTYEQTKAKIKSSQADPNIWELNLEDIEKGGQLLQKKSVQECKSKGDKTIFHIGDILYSKLRPYLLKIIIADEDGICTSEIVPFRLYGNIYSKYIVYTLKSPFVDSYINSVTYGVKMPRAGTDTMINLYLPLPPLSEQYRIVAKLQELEPLIEKYRIAEEQLHELNYNIKEQLKKSILQYAIEGKLVPQDPNDEPASVLLERIRKEKEMLIAEGKIKKDNIESVIYRRDNSYYEKQGKNEACIDELISFDIPNNWIWTRLSSITNTLGGYAFKSAEYTNTGVRVIRISDFDNDGILDDEYKYYHEEEALNKYLLKENDILLCMTGGTVGKVCVNNKKTKQYLNQRVAAIRTSDLIYYRYIYKVITSNYIQNIINKSKTSTNDNISMDTINDFLIPLPPFNEQIRICEAIDKI